MVLVIKNPLISVPPRRPQVQGYIDGETIRMGQTVTLVCESYGGNPLASIVWYKNNQRIDHSYTTSGIVFYSNTNIRQPDFPTYYPSLSQTLE